MTHFTKEDVDGVRSSLLEALGEDWNDSITRYRIAIMFAHCRKALDNLREELEAERRLSNRVESALARRLADAK